LQRIKPVTRIWHGDTVIDNYYWMIDYFKKGPDSTKVVELFKSRKCLYRYHDEWYKKITEEFIY
jgi:hypothetical protein